MSRHELDDLFSTTVSAAMAADVLVVTNPLPGDALPAEFTATSSPTCAAWAPGPGRPVPTATGRGAGRRARPGEAQRLGTGAVRGGAGRRGAGPPGRGGATARPGAESVIVTRGGLPAFATAPDGREYEFTPPRFDHGSPEGCGDSMMGGMATGWAQGLPWLDVVTLGMAAGAANFLRHGLGTGVRGMVEQLTPDRLPRPGASPEGEPARRAPSGRRRRRSRSAQRARSTPYAAPTAAHRPGPRSRGTTWHPVPTGVMAVAGQHMDQPGLGQHPHPRSAGGSLMVAAVAWISAPSSTSRASRSNRSAVRCRSGWAIRSGSPLSQCHHRVIQGVGQRPGFRF